MNWAAVTVDPPLSEGEVRSEPSARIGMSKPFSPEATMAQNLLPCERDQELLLAPACAVAERRGPEVKSLGDGLMVAFASARDALEWAAVEGRNRTSGEPALALRVGVHAGEPLHEADDDFGTAVVVAKRLCDGSLQIPVAAFLNRRTTSAADGSPATSRFLNRLARADATIGLCDGQPSTRWAA